MTTPLFYTWLSERPGRIRRLCGLTPHFWAEAALLGAARLRSNNTRRAHERDRGNENARVDLMGGASEVLLYRMLLQFETDVEQWARIRGGISATVASQVRSSVSDGLRYMRQHMYVESGGHDVKGADFMHEGVCGRWAVDAKSFDFAQNKRRFAINDKKHRQLATLVPEYFCMLCPPLAKRAFVVVVPYHFVDSWETEILRRTNPDPARVLPIDIFTSAFLGRTRASCEQAIASDRYPTQDILASAASGGLGVERISESSPLIGKSIEKNSTALDDYVAQLLRYERLIS
ncbi:hypothetical protein JYB32_33330 [Burkholderia cenocepacia]|uniref:hypothetical protein n=1 Tax=Burkholderia cenocepacia TaxID=95486 RepID=UPI00196AA101|nr:hypothetical protein [Burkholderia cenocepacia]MBN3534230.1 hypothetical protein [Burkholderia cenocepacia]